MSKPSSAPNLLAPQHGLGLQPAPAPRRPAMPAWAWAALGALAAGVIAPAALMLSARAPAPAPAPPAMKVDKTGVLLAPDAPQWPYVELAVAKEGAPIAPLPAPARIGFDELRTSAIGAPLAGRVERVLVHIGDRVEPGARLFAVRSGAFAEVQKELEAARVSVEVKKRLADRVRELVAIKASPEKDLAAAEAELHEAELALSAARAKYDSLKVAPEANNLFYVVAPRRGTVVETDVWADQEVTPDREKPLLRLSDLDEVLALADVQEVDAADIAQGARVEVRAQAGGVVREGTVQHVSEVVDPARRTVEVRVRVKNQDRALRPNSFAEITFTPDPALQRVRVPSEAVVTDGERSVVFVAQGPGRLERQAVKTGRQRDGEVEVLSGLAPGSRYVARGALLLLNQIELVQ